jgi:transposase
VSPTDPKVRFLAERAALHPHPERVQDTLFHDAPFFDPRDLVQVRYEMLRRCRVDGQPPARVARAFGVSRQLLHLSARAFQAEGLPGLFPRKRGPRAAHKCTDEVMAFVLLRRSQSPRLTLAELLGEVERSWGVRLHRRTLERHLAALGKKLQRRPRKQARPFLRPLT